ncbi:MAG TPA: hydroxymethylbilane synthase [Acidimicrobiales bacterium]|nr:hydroxymethylbilane synthase [Acidimicrobiales bacterium]
MPARPQLRLATRGSPLALWQARRVAGMLADRAQRDASAVAEVTLVIVETAGDRNTVAPLHALGGQGVFVKEVQAAVLRGEADAAVHSAKDLPASPDLSPEGLMLAAFPERADPSDLLVGGHWDTLPPGATVATGSVRRRTQLANLRPDLTYTGLRGNIGTRLASVGQGDVVALIVAKAAVDRLGWEPPDGVDTEVLDRMLIVPQVGQGALAVECRTDDGATRAQLSAIDDAVVRRTVSAERAYLAALGGGCTLPVGAYAEVASDEPGSDVELTAILASEDGRVVLRHTARGNDPERLGADVARYLLDDCGGAALGSWGDGEGTAEAVP